jgi:hypothetical protein
MNTASKVNIKHNLNVENYRDGLTFEDGRIIDHERSRDNIVLMDRYDVHKQFRTNVLTILGEKNVALLENNLEDYNAGKRKSRQIGIKDLFDEKRKQHFEHRECIIQFGNREDDISERDQVEMLKQAFDCFKQTYKFAFISSAVIHLDESTPHLHITFVPIQLARDKQKGVPLNLSLDSCLGGGRGKFAEARDKLDKGLEDIARSRGYRVKNPKIKRAHKDQRAYNELLAREKALEARRDEIEHELLVGQNRLQASQNELEKRENELLEREKELKEREEFNKHRLADGKLFMDYLHQPIWSLSYKLGLDPTRDDQFAKACQLVGEHLKTVEPARQEPTREVDPKRGLY